jgi:hypothetical protein
MQPSIFDVRPAHDGPDLTPDDQVRLAGHLLKVVELMADGRERTLMQIAAAVGCTESSAGARCRDLRKRKFGAFTVTKRRVGNLFFYSVTR